MELLIDLESKDRRSINVEQAWSISIFKKFYEEKNGIFFSFLRKRAHIEKYVSLNIENVVVDKRLVCNPVKLFTIIYTGEVMNNNRSNDIFYDQNKRPITIPLHSYDVPFQIHINQAEIKDCNEAQQVEESTYPIEFDVVLRDPSKNNEIIHRQTDRIDVKFKVIKVVPCIGIELDNDGELQYSSVGDLQPKIGSLFIKLLNPLNRAPSIDLNITVDMLDEYNKLTQDVLLIKNENNESEDEIQLKDLCCLYEPESNSILSRKYALYFDLSKVKNPMDSKAYYTIEVKPKYRSSYNIDSPGQPLYVPPETITLLKDCQGTELVVSMTRNWQAIGENGQETRSLAEDIKTDSTIVMPQIHFSSVSLQFPIQIYLKNKATDTSWPRAGVTVKNLRVNSSFANNNVSLTDENNEKVNSQSIIRLQNEDPAITGRGVFIANGENAFMDFQLVFSPRSIVNLYGIDDFGFEVNTKLDFDYCEDITGTGENSFKHFCSTIIWSLYQDPSPEWLGIDYGSSAIVCYFGSGEKGGLIDLAKARKEVYSNDKKFKEGEKKDTIEQNTFFLSSDIILHDVKPSDKVSSLCSQISFNLRPNYSEMSVLLSPTSSLIVSNFRRQLPCLKILMGNEFLPENANYREYSYNCKRDTVVENVKAGEIKDQADSLIRINSIFKEAYYTLFRYFVHEDGLLEKVNQVVLTYPNTYTPRNLNTLKEIIKKLFNNVRNVKFVSESDAVAAYYMSHWNDYHKQGDDIYAPEEILVFDMGGGTLDLTCLTKAYDPDTKKFTLEIKGKIGTGKAGNYLDFVIANVLGELFPNDIRLKNIIGTSLRGVQEDILSARVKLKEIIKNTIKPALNEVSKEISFTLNDKPYSVNTTHIMEHMLFKRFLDETTKGILSHLKNCIDGDSFKVDTVIMSGRSLRLDKLQEALSNQLKGAKYIMLDKIVSGASEGMKTDRLKTAVVEGAKTYVETYMNENTGVIIKSKRLQASYGVAYSQTGGAWKYAELLNRNNIPFSSESQEIFRLPNPVIISGTNEGAVLKFVQSYLSAADAEKALNEKNFEFITVMEEVMMASFHNAPSLIVNICVDRNNNISLEINGRTTEGQTPKGVDLNDQITRSSLWPISIEE